MSILSAIFLVLSLAAAIMVGPQMRQWSWGPALILLGVSLVTGLPALWRNKRTPNLGVLVIAVITGAWFLWRAWMSPVAEFAKADAILIAGAIGGILAIGGIVENRKATAVFLWGIAILLALSIWVIIKQKLDPSFSPIFPSRPRDLPSGFFGHYNDGANFLIGAAFFLGASSLSPRHPIWTRLIWGLVSLAGIGSIYLTASRGGILAGAACLFLFPAICLLATKKRSGWSAILAVGLPVVAIVVGGLLWKGWSRVQELRYQSTSASGAMDNPIRLSLLDIASQCIPLAPLSGSGSRSFSWNCYQFWDTQAYGPAGARPEMVHNELVQSATDYGLIGAGLLIVLFSAATIGGILKLIFSKNEEASESTRTFLIIGGIVGLAGMIVQSCFSFVFHVFPGALLMGLTLGAFLWPKTSEFLDLRGKIFNLVASLAAVGIATALVITGWHRTQVLVVLWKPYFSESNSLWVRADALGKAISILPLPSLQKERGIALQSIANSSDTDAARARDLALESYSQAIANYPFDPVVSLNRAILLDTGGQEFEAEKEFLRTIQIQGGAENLFRGHLRYANFLLKRGARQLGAQDYASAIVTFQTAFAHCDQIRNKAPWVMDQTAEGLKLNASLHENIGNAYFLSGEMENALMHYRTGAKLPTGIRIHYRASLVLARYAELAWSERKPSEALARFLQAQTELAAATELPFNVTPEEKMTYASYLAEKIGFLTGAKIEPMKLDDP